MSNPGSTESSPEVSTAGWTRRGEVQQNKGSTGVRGEC